MAQKKLHTLYTPVFRQMAVQTYDVKGKFCLGVWRGSIAVVCDGISVVKLWKRKGRLRNLNSRWQFVNNYEEFVVFARKWGEK